MYKYIFNFMVVAFVLAAPLFGFAATPQNADVSVVLSGPSSITNYATGTYSAVVKNNGPVTATGITLSITLPQTGTSPQVYILGTISGVTSPCSIINRTIQCNIGNLKKGKTATISYNYNAPIANKSLAMSAVVTSQQNDNSTGNNTSVLTPNLTYPERDLSLGAQIINSHCTGTNITSYFECALFPSSISTYNTVFNSDGTITIPEPGYTGRWTHNGDKTTLKMEYFDINGDKQLEFNGRAHGSLNCFDGLSEFFPTSTYNSAYRVCVQ